MPVDTLSRAQFSPGMGGLFTPILDSQFATARGWSLSSGVMWSVCPAFVPVL